MCVLLVLIRKRVCWVVKKKAMDITFINIHVDDMFLTQKKNMEKPITEGNGVFIRLFCKTSPLRYAIQDLARYKIESKSEVISLFWSPISWYETISVTLLYFQNKWGSPKYGLIVSFYRTNKFPLYFHFAKEKLR